MTVSPRTSGSKVQKYEHSPPPGSLRGATTGSSDHSHGPVAVSLTATPMAPSPRQVSEPPPAAVVSVTVVKR